jgi:catechol 2,3-dioxygenase-like lactoylglutathione lyase family enzyme
MYVGAPTLCLRVKDLDRSTAFYQALGMEVYKEVPGKRANLRRGGFKLALMTFGEKEVLNFRGVDAFAIHSHLQEKGLELVGRPERYTKEQYDADADGECWATEDPDGRDILFDTNENEKGEAAKQSRLTQLLKNTEQELVDIGASQECIQVFREKVLARFGTPQ